MTESYAQENVSKCLPHLGDVCHNWVVSATIGDVPDVAGACELIHPAVITDLLHNPPPAGHQLPTMAVLVMT